MGIRAKLIFWISILFILMGVLIYFPLSIILPQKITNQIIKRDTKIAECIAREVMDPLLIDDKLSINLILNDYLQNFQDARYIFIQGGSGEIIAHTFQKGFPKGLLDIGTQPYQAKEFLANGKKFYDISIPVFGGELGNLHLGVSLIPEKKEIVDITKINYYVLFIVLVGLGAGILIFLTLGIIFSNRIIELKRFTARVGNGDLDTKINTKTQDEIGSLAAAFNKMTANLKEKIEEVKRLSTIEERNRIAFELHDGLAQSLADIKFRIELCEKLFTRDPQRALSELNELKENTRGILVKTREAIFDLRLSQGGDFNISEYIKDFSRKSGILVDLIVVGDIQKLPLQVKQVVFRIVREALINIKKHSGAKTASVLLELTNTKMAITVKDDGEGFDLANIQIEEKTGLNSMRERAQSLGGIFELHTAPGHGTEVLVNIPIEDKEVVLA